MEPVDKDCSSIKVFLYLPIYLICIVYPFIVCVVCIVYVFCILDKCYILVIYAIF